MSLLKIWGDSVCAELSVPTRYVTCLLTNNINIPSQYLQTNEAIDDVVIDIDVAHSDIALAKLAEVPGTLRSRVLF